MRVVTDPNILISATFWLGDSSEIINKVKNNEIELILSEETLNEYIRVLNYKEIREKIEAKNLSTKITINELIKISTFVPPSQNIQIVEDPDDNKFIEAAIEGQAQYIISQDKHLLKIKEYQGIKIVSPEEFLKVLDSKK